MRKKSPASGDDASVAGEPGVGAREKKIEEGFVLRRGLSNPAVSRSRSRKGGRNRAAGSAAADAAVRRRNGGRQSAYPCALSF